VANIFQPVAVIAEDGVVVVTRAERQPLGESALRQSSFIAFAGTRHERCRKAHPTACVGIAIMVDHQRTFIAIAVRERKHILVHMSVGRIEVVQQEMVGAGEQVTAVEQREDFALVPRNQPLIRLLVPIGAVILHAILFGKPLDLPVPKHRQPRHGDQQRADAEVFIAFAKLIDRRALIGVIHKVDEAAQHFRVELEHIFS
jgi:hypothetical protein